MVTIRPVGVWCSLTHVWFLLAFCPPALDAAKVSITTSAGLSSKSTSSASGIIATVIVDVWTRPFDSVSGIRWTRWTHDSNFILLYTLSPLILTIAILIHQVSAIC